MVTISESREIAWVAYLSEIAWVANYKMSSPGTAGVLACAICYSKKIAVSQSREIGRVAHLGQITNIGSGRGRKL